MSHKALNGRHTTTVFYQKVLDRKWCCLAEEEARAGSEMAITAYGTPLAPVTSFNYLGQIKTAVDNNWPTVVSNLWKTSQKWSKLIRVLGRDGADAWTLVQI